jgi:hypothetical protein
MRRVFYAALTAALLAACSIAPETAPQGAYELTVAFAAALKAGNAYAAMPRCSAVQKDPCSRQPVVNRIASEATKADTAVKRAQAEAGDRAAMSAANDAIKALTQTIPAR